MTQSERGPVVATRAGGLPCRPAAEARTALTAKQIKVFCREEALYFTSQVPWACISIATQQNTWPEIDEAHRVGLLRLAFADLESPVAGCEPVVFDAQCAGRILDFVKAVWDEIALLAVHCEAGLCRSPAVAAAISRVYLGEDKPFFRPGHYDPNRLVYHTLLDVARERKEYLEPKNPKRRRKTIGRRRKRQHS